MNRFESDGVEAFSEDEEFEKLHEKYKIISRAVGMINSGIVDHNRG